nr:hypothetical protein BaRGS_025564 [Batillaria attramentaria]
MEKELADIGRRVGKWVVKCEKNDFSVRKRTSLPVVMNSVSGSVSRDLAAEIRAKHFSADSLKAPFSLSAGAAGSGYTTCQ